MPLSPKFGWFAVLKLSKRASGKRFSVTRKSFPGGDPGPDHYIAANIAPLPERISYEGIDIEPLACGRNTEIQRLTGCVRPIPARARKVRPGADPKREAGSECQDGTDSPPTEYRVRKAARIEEPAAFARRQVVKNRSDETLLLIKRREPVFAFDTRVVLFAAVGGGGADTAAIVYGLSVGVGCEHAQA